jgi:hypothetical protein
MLDVFQVVHHTENTSPISRLELTAIYITPQTLNNFNFHFTYPFLCNIILHYYSKVKGINHTYIFLISWSDINTLNYNCILLSETSPGRCPEHVGEHIVNKNT